MDHEPTSYQFPLAEQRFLLELLPATDLAQNVHFSHINQTSFGNEWLLADVDWTHVTSLCSWMHTKGVNMMHGMSLGQLGCNHSVPCFAWSSSARLSP